MRKSLTAVLLDWYYHYARELPWRNDPDPYGIWVSEVMLQQTRVDTVIPYFLHWMERFPTITALAEASQQEVLVVWEGLGYYSRARNLQRAAQIVIRDYGGSLPGDMQALRKLPGIGRYTAGAIASIAFGLDEPALDGNIRRVLARFFDVSEPEKNPAGEKRLWELAAANLPTGQAGDYNQALMDLGATICTPRNPQCAQCPLGTMCQAYALGIQEQRPVVKPRGSIPHIIVTAAIVQRQGRVLIAQRPQNGLLGGLWEFPGGKLNPGEDLIACLKREICEELGLEVIVDGAYGVYRHAYTHFRVTLHAFCCRPAGANLPQVLQVQDIRWVAPSELAGYPMGKIDRRIASRLINDQKTVVQEIAHQTMVQGLC